MIQFMRKKAMATPVTGKEVNRASREVTANNCIRRGAKRGMNFVFFRTSEALDLIEAAAADDTNCRLVVLHPAAIIQKAKRLERGYSGPVI
jgi:hypothetical protein